MHKFTRDTSVVNFCKGSRTIANLPKLVTNARCPECKRVVYINHRGEFIQHRTEAPK